MLSALAAYRFLLGIGIGGEYPAGSVGCSESTGELESGTRNRWFIWFTNLAIDAGFVVAAFVPMVVVGLSEHLIVPPQLIDCTGSCYWTGSSPCRLAHHAWNRCHPSSLFVLHEIQAARARSLPEEHNGQVQNPLEAHLQEVLVPFAGCFDHLVHLRLLIIRFWNLLRPKCR